MDVGATDRWLELACVVQAPPERVFALLTEPAELARWWGPHGFTVVRADVDLRVGGAYRLTMQPPTGDVFHIAGEYVEVVRPARLVTTFRYEEPTADDRETVVTLVLRASDQARDAVTEVGLGQGAFATEERLELHRAGWTDSFDRLRATADADRG
jgi:uncharacterized protein YndB with AHSA1/START domain